MAGLAAPARLPKLPFQSSAYAFGLRRGAPGLGEHTVELLAELGVDAAEQATLAAQGAVLLGSADAVPRDWPERPFE